MAFEELSAGFETGNLVLLRRIGAGGMGTVWLAEHRTLRTRVAVKFVTDEVLLGDAIALERFAREAEILARLKNPHVVQVLDRSMTNSGIPYLVMELLEGETLSRHITRQGSASLSIVRRVVEQVGKALTKAHMLGVVHRDIKPDNIFLARIDDELVCKVFDFGVAKEHREARSDALTGSGAMVGTPSYMSPEQFADSGAVDEHVDLWSLAVVAYIGLTGSRPFTGRDLVELCRNVLRGNYVPPSRREGSRPDLAPERVDAWFQKAFAPQRQDRFASAEEMVAAFVESLGELGAEEPDLDSIDDAIPRVSGRGLRPGAKSSDPGSIPRARTSDGARPRVAMATQRSLEPLPTRHETATAPNEEPSTFAATADRAAPLDEPTRKASRDLASEPTIALGPRNIRRLLAGGALVTAGALGLLFAGRENRSHGVPPAAAPSAVSPSPVGAGSGAAPAVTDGERPTALPPAALTASAVTSTTKSVEPPHPELDDRAASAPPPKRTSPATAPRKTSAPGKRARRSDLDYDHGF